MSLTSLHVDVLFVIFDYLVLMFAEDVVKWPFRTKYLIPVSETCRTLRTVAIPFLFREAYNWKRFETKVGQCDESPVESVWPPSVGQFIRKLHVRDFDEGHKPIDMRALELVLPKLPALNHIRFELIAPPPADLISSAAAVSTLDTIEFHKARFDGPSLAPTFSRFSHLQSFAMSIGLSRTGNINLEQELENIKGILSSIAGTLVELEISGDLVEMTTLSTISWPCLRKLVLTDHIPFGKTIPLTSMVGQMPCLRTLGLNFTAVVKWDLMPIIFCFDLDDVSSPPLSSVLPHLQVFSISNALPEDPLFDQLPPNLEVLRVLALRDHLPGYDYRQQQWYSYSTLNDTAAFRVIEIAGRLPLVELALNLEKAPSPSILEAIAASCPNLRVLELEEWRHDIHHIEPQYPLASLIRPLLQLQHLRDLRLTLELGDQDDSGAHVWPFARTRLFSRMNAAAQEFAEGLPQLHYISFSYWNSSKYNGILRNLIWYGYGIYRGKPGEPPFVKFLDFF
ncbi:hypothetical protein Hypma_004998 [Hypsizygus marmoreus]|uniref:F-box domain-containing protein n=1 Tax=Hypsizygus marmoreus TaxID=39966 RepID=A0A369JXA2_HYPMA|nr:hypothetical protein Hypma_004998 [Hypsizygus marmoreus]